MAHKRKVRKLENKLCVVGDSIFASSNGISDRCENAFFVPDSSFKAPYLPSDIVKRIIFRNNRKLIWTLNFNG